MKFQKICFNALAVWTLFFGLHASAALSQFQLGKDRVSFYVPKDWQAMENIYGFPLAILGPKTKTGRPAIAISPTEIENLKFDPNALKNQDTYQSERRVWAESVGAQVLHFYPYKMHHWESGEAHEIGFRYRLGKREFSEHSYYAYCKNRLYHIKTLLHDSHELLMEKTTALIVKTFTCEKAS